METVYTQQFTLTDLHLDRFGRLKPSVLFYFIQEVSGAHASRLGASWEALDEKNLFWAIIRHHVEIFHLPEGEQTITLRTWPMPTTRVAYPRATEGYDEQGNLLFRSHAIWVLMDTVSRAMVLPGKSGVDVPGSLQGSELAAPGSIRERELPNTMLQQVGYSLLDRNGHMNNTRYLDWVDDLLDSDFHKAHPLTQVQICYLAEAREGQNIRLSWLLDETNTLRVEAHTEEEKPHRVFAINAQFGRSVQE